MDFCKVLIIFQEFLIAIFVSALENNQCNAGDSIFIQSKEMDISSVGIDGWEQSFENIDEVTCRAKCHANAQCKSATFTSANNLDSCSIRNVNRMNAGIYIARQPNQSTTTKYYEKHQCNASLSSADHQYIAMVTDVTDCKDIYNKGWKVNGVYGIQKLGSNVGDPILCEMSLLGGGWTVIQQRVDGSIGFNKNWASYKHGFGELTGNFWYGNDRLHNLTKDQSNQILIYLEQANGQKNYPMYNEFKVAGEDDFYRLTLGSYLATLGTDLTYSAYTNFEGHNQMMFSTIDKDKDGSDSRFCGQEYQSGWWFMSCWEVYLNGVYGDTTDKGIVWDHFTLINSSPRQHDPFVKTQMMIRKK